MNYALASQLQAEKAIPIQRICLVLGVSRSGFYTAQTRKQKAPVVCATSAHLNSHFEASGRCYGSRRLQSALNRQGIKIGRHRVRSLMRAQGL
jgi:putative transposase